LFLDDIRGYPIFISDMVGANQEGESYDGFLLKTIPVEKIISPMDCLIGDHHFDCEFRRLIDSEEINLEKKNFLPQVTKTRKVSLTTDEIDYHDAHGAFRSKQETERNAFLVHTWKAFSSKSEKKNVNFLHLQLQLKFVNVLNGISKFALTYPKFFDHIENDQWIDPDFDFNNFRIEVESEKIQELQQRSLKLQNDHNIFIDSLLNPHLSLKTIMTTQPVLIDKNSSEVLVQNPKKQKKKDLEEINFKAKKQKADFTFPEAANYSQNAQMKLIEKYHKKLAFKCVACKELDGQEYMLNDLKLLNGWCCLSCFEKQFYETFPNSRYEICYDCNLVIYDPIISKNYFHDGQNSYCTSCQFAE
jgi:hypothetical protein